MQGIDQIYIWSKLNHRTRAVYATQTNRLTFDQSILHGDGNKDRGGPTSTGDSYMSIWRHRGEIRYNRGIGPDLCEPLALYLGLLTEQRDLHGPGNLATLFDSWA